MSSPDETYGPLLTGHLSRVGASLFVGPDGGCVPRMAGELSLAVARGESWRGSATLRGPVLYVHIEAPVAPLRADLCALGARSDDDLQILFASADARLLDRVRDRARTLAPVLIVVDPLSALLRAEDQASECPASTALDRVLDLASELETHLLALHPLGPDEPPRVSALLQSTSRSIDALGIVGSGGSLRWLAGSSGSGTGIPGPRAPRSVAAPALPAPPRPVAPPPEISGLAERVLEHLREHPAPVTFQDLRRALDMPACELQSALRELLCHGRLLAELSEGGAHDSRYSGCDLEPSSGGWLRQVRPFGSMSPGSLRDEGLSEARTPASPIDLSC